MRYAIFTDIHANLEALEAVLAKIDQLAQEEPIDQIWFLGDLVGYGPNPNECIDKLRERTDVIIAGNHDWAAVGKIDLEDFSEAARISAEWTAEQLTEEHRDFLANLPERLEHNDCTLVHGSPYGPLWEYLTSEVLAERSFQHFSTRFCVVGHTHVPVIFQQPDVVANSPTAPLELDTQDASEEEALKRVLEHIPTTTLTEDDANNAANETPTDSDFAEAETNAENEESAAENTAEDDTDAVEPDEEAEEAVEETVAEEGLISEITNSEAELPAAEEIALDDDDEEETTHMPAVQFALLTSAQSNKPYSELTRSEITIETKSLEETLADAADVVAEVQYQLADDHPAPTPEAEVTEVEFAQDNEEEIGEFDEEDEAITPEATIQDAEERLNEEIEELLSLLGLSQSMINVTNEMIIPPEGQWQASKGHRAIINPGGVGQPRDGDPRAAFMIYDTEHGFTFYRIPYSFEETQEKIIQANLPQYLATRLAYGR